MQENEVYKFVTAHQSRAMKVVEKHAQEVNFSSSEWIKIHQICRVGVKRTNRYYNLEAAALKKAVEMASSLADWVRLAGYVGRSSYRETIFNEIFKFDITTQEDINILLQSGSYRLAAVGWYLDAKRKQQKG